MAKKKEPQPEPKEYFECMDCLAKWVMNTSGCPNCKSSRFEIRRK